MVNNFTYGGVPQGKEGSPGLGVLVILFEVYNEVYEL